MAQSFERFYQAYGRFVDVLGLLAGAIAFAIMWLIDLNVFTRKAFNAPVQGTFEFTEAGLVLIVFFALAFTQRRRGHIRVTILTSRLPLGVQHALYVIVLFIAALLIAWYAYAAFAAAERSFKLNEQEWGVVRFAIWPVKAAIALGCAAFSLQFLLDSIRHCFVWRGELAAVGDEP
ncbi:MAG: TRAP transporter small permease [Alphaproteobacteria bacterium]